MRKAVFVAVLGFALTFAGCRDITTDLHDIHTITLNPGSAAAVNGQRIVVLETDVWGRLRNLPVPQRVEWVFYCGWLGPDLPEHLVPVPVFSESDRGVDSWLRDVIDWVYRRAIHGWEVGYRDGYGNDVFEKFFHGQDFCELNGCDLFDWIHLPDAGSVRFLGWFTSGHSRVTSQTVFERDTTIHARWAEAGAELGPVAARIAELHVGGLPLAATVYVNSLEYIGPQSLDFGGRPITITLRRSADAPCPCGVHCPCAGWSGCDCEPYVPLYLSGPGAMFTVGAGVTLILEDVGLFGFHRNYASLMVVEAGGRLELRDGALLAWNNTNSNRYGGAVTVHRGGTLVMEGGRIWQNTFRNPFVAGLNFLGGGGGVWVRGGEFYMSGGIIDENVALGAGAAVRVSHGGAFTMTGGMLYDNGSWAGGGVYVGGSGDFQADPDGDFTGASTFVMKGGYIEYNFGTVFGAGVAVGLFGRFDMFDGDIWFNEGGDGVGVDNEGVVVMHGGAIWLNSSVRAQGTGGVTNFNRFEMWDGLIGINEGTIGGGVRNFGDFYMFGGSIQGNIANGGMAGGVINISQFRMHGGEISNNISNVQGGGIVHGLSGDADSGQFVLTDGMIWNNRDLTTHHEDGLPGSMGNVRRSHPHAGSFTLARLGFFSLDPAERPAGWSFSSGYVPVFDGVVPAPRPPGHNVNVEWQWDWYNRSGVIPGDWPSVQRVYFFAPPAPTYPVFSWQIPQTEGRPRVEINTTNNPGPFPVLVMNTDVPSVTTHQENPRDRRPLRGGVTFPSSLVTAHTDYGFAWLVRHGHMTAEVLEINLTRGDGTGNDLRTVAGWPVPPTLIMLADGGLHTILPELSLADAWPWERGSASAAFRADWHPPLLPPSDNRVEVREHPAMERLRQRMPNWQEYLESRTGLSGPIQPEEDLIGHRRRLLDNPPPELVQRLHDRAHYMIYRRGSGGGISPSAR